MQGEMQKDSGEMMGYADEMVAEEMKRGEAGEMQGRCRVRL